MSNTNSNVEFKRKTYAKGFNNHKGLDEFIQGSLDKYQFVDPKEDMYEATGDYSKYIVSNKSAIPDLVIWNKKFNKNECFYGADSKEYNSFPRFKFILRAKPSNNSGKATIHKGRENKGKILKLFLVGNSNKILEKKENVGVTNFISNYLENEKEREDKIQNNQSDVKRELYDEDEEPQWIDVDVTEFENVKIVFKALPGKEKDINAGDKKISEISDIFVLNQEKEKSTEKKKEEFSIHENDESNDHSHLERIIKLNLTSEDEKTNDNIILKDEKEFPILNTETMFSLNYDIFMDNKPKEINQSIVNEKVKDMPVITLEKNSLFEKDFTFIFKSTEESLQLQKTKEDINNKEESLENLTGATKKHDFQIEQSSNILFENNLFEVVKNKQDHELEIDELKNLQKNLLPNNQIHFNHFDEEDDEEQDDRKLLNFSGFPNNNNPNMMRDNNFMNTNIPKQINMNMRIGMPFNLPQNPNIIPIPIHPMNMMNNFGNVDEFSQNENMFKNQFIKNNAMNQMNHNQPVINPIFLENPTSIVQKNMYKKGWLLMTLNDKILGQFNSIDLFKCLDKKISEGWNFEHTWITDYETDMYFTPANLYEILKEIVPNVLGSQMINKIPPINFGNINMNMNMNPNMNMSLNPNFNPNGNLNFNPIPMMTQPLNMRQINMNKESKMLTVNKSGNNNLRLNTPSSMLHPTASQQIKGNQQNERENNWNLNMNMINQIPFNIDPRLQNGPNNIQSIPIHNMHSLTPNPKRDQNYNIPNNFEQGMQPPLNMNINLQFVKNNINLNNIMLNNNGTDGNQTLSRNVTVTPKTGPINIGNNFNKPVLDKNQPGNKDTSKSNNNKDSSIFNSNMFPAKSPNLNTNNNTNRLNLNKKKK